MTEYLHVDKSLIPLIAPFIGVIFLLIGNIFQTREISKDLEKLQCTNESFIVVQRDVEELKKDNEKIWDEIHEIRFSSIDYFNPTGQAKEKR